MIRFLTVLTLSCLFCSALEAVPADSRETAQVLVEIPSLQHLEIERFAIHVPNPSIIDRQRGYIDLPDAIQLRVSSNTPWRLLLFSDDRGFRKGNTQDKPLEHFQWCVRGCNQLHSLRREPQLVAESRSFADHELYVIDCRVLLDWDTDSPGEHQLSMRLELETVEGV